MNVLVIPEDFRKDQYILKPIIEAIFAAISPTKANVRVCQDPLLGGVSHALNWDRVREVIDRYRGMIHVFLLIVDRDGHETRRDRLTVLEQNAEEVLPAGRFLLAENAYQELEVWTLAGHDLPADWKWREIRAEVNPKETYFEQFALLKGVSNEPGGGRKTLSIQAARRYSRVRQLCLEDIGRLESRLKERLA